MTLLPNPQSAGVDKLEYRDRLYYNKFKYRGTITMIGLNRTYWCGDLASYNFRIQSQIAGGAGGFSDTFNRRLKERYNQTDLPAIQRYFDFRNTMSDDKSVAILRLENDKASFFSNDLNWLRGLDTVLGHSLGSVEYTEASAIVQAGVKYFRREPKYKNRMYFKMTKLTDTEIQELYDFVLKYDPDIVEHPPIKASTAFMEFLRHGGKQMYHFRNNWLGAHHYIDYDDERYLVLVALQFSNLMGKTFRLEKRNDNQ